MERENCKKHNYLDTPCTSYIVDACMIFKSKTFFLFSSLHFHTRNLYIINHFCFTNKRFINTTEFIVNIRYIFWFVSIFFCLILHILFSFNVCFSFTLHWHCTPVAIFDKRRGGQKARHSQKHGDVHSTYAGERRPLPCSIVWALQ